MKPKVFYAGMPGDGTGWGVCNANLIRELGKLCDLTYGDAEGPLTFSDATIFMPIADHGLRPTSDVRGWRNFGYCFFEYPLEECAAENAKQYDLIFCGSTWCQQRLAERGIRNTHVLIQGVDTDIFKPGPGRQPDGEIWIFSGGKFEYRKGQDLVLAAFKEVIKTHPRTRLITAWHNPWPQTMDTMSESQHIIYELCPGTWPEQLGHLCEINGIPKDRVLTTAATLPNRDMPNIYRQCDFGVFPNRCEGGTNLVMMEFMACGRAVIASSATGHRDIFQLGGGDFAAGALHGYLENKTQWFHPLLNDLIALMSEAIEKPEELKEMGAEAASTMRQWTWERAAQTIAAEL